MTPQLGSKFQTLSESDAVPCFNFGSAVQKTRLTMQTIDLEEFKIKSTEEIWSLDITASLDWPITH